MSVARWEQAFEWQLCGFLRRIVEAAAWTANGNRCCSADWRSGPYAAVLSGRALPRIMGAVAHPSGAANAMAGRRVTPLRELATSCPRPGSLAARIARALPRCSSPEPTGMREARTRSSTAGGSGPELEYLEPDANGARRYSAATQAALRRYLGQYSGRHSG